MWATVREGIATRQAKRSFMLNTIAVVLLVPWLLGLVTSTTMGGFIHVLLRVISGRKVL